MNLANVLRVNAANHGDRAAILFDGRQLSYAEAWERVRGIAGELDAAGVTTGDRVGLAMADHPDHLLAHFAVAVLGAVILPIDHRWTASEKRRAADAFDARLVLTDGESIDGIETLAPGTTAGIDPGPPVTVDGADLLVSLSSGSTGRPKGALVTHENLYERFVSQWVAIGYDSRDCLALVTPLYFGAGRSFAMSFLVAGGTVRLAPPPLKPPELLAVLAEPGVTATFLPPTLLRRLLPLFSGERLLPDLDYLVVSGEPLYAAEAAECLDKICPNIVTYYASSEGGGISVLASRDVSEHADTVGIPTFRTDVEIVDAEGRVLGIGEVGRLRYRGPGVASRFVDEDGNVVPAEAGGWFYPGDLAERLPGGYLALRGRDKDVIIRGGVNVYPAEIERVLLEHPAIREAAVIGLDDEGRGQSVVACVAGDEVPEAATLTEFCRERLAPYKVPAEFRVFRDLPRRASGKVDRQALAEP